MFLFFFLFFFFFQDEPEPISVYHPMAEELFASMGIPMEGFFDGTDVVFEAATPTPPVATQGVPAEAPILSTEPVPIGKGTYTEGISETAPIPAKTLTPQEGAVPPAIIQTEVASRATPLVISTSVPFIALSQVVKDGLVVTLSSIPSSTTRGPDADLSSERSEDVIEDLDDKPTMKKRVSDSEEEESAEHEAESMGMCLFILLSFLFPPFSFSFLLSRFYTYVFVSPLCCGLPLFCMSLPLIAETFEEPEVAANTDMPTTTSLAAPVAPISAIPSAPVSTIPTTPVLAISTAPTLTGPSMFSFPHFFLHFFIVSSFSLAYGFSYHASCFLDRSTSHCPFSI